MFTQDSTIIYCGDGLGVLYAYSTIEEYKLFYKR